MVLMTSVLMGVFIKFYSQRTRAPTLKVFWLFQVASFFMSMVWIYMFANIIVDLLELFALLTGMSTALLGLTILSWGNSIGDSIASCSISRKGYGEMAFTSCIAGPVFNLMMGLGLATLQNNIHLENGIEFDISNKDNISSFATILSSIFILVILIWMVVMNDYKAKTRDAKIIIFLYIVAIVVISYLTL